MTDLYELCPVCEGATPCNWCDDLGLVEHDCEGQGAGPTPDTEVGRGGDPRQAPERTARVGSSHSVRISHGGTN